MSAVWLQSSCQFGGNGVEQRLCLTLDLWGRYILVSGNKLYTRWTTDREGLSGLADIDRCLLDITPSILPCRRQSTGDHNWQIVASCRPRKWDEASTTIVWWNLALLKKHSKTILWKSTVAGQPLGAVIPSSIRGWWEGYHAHHGLPNFVWDRLSGNKMRDQLYFATASGNRTLFVELREGSLIDKLPTSYRKFISIFTCSLFLTVNEQYSLFSY